MINFVRMFAIFFAGFVAVYGFFGAVSASEQPVLLTISVESETGDVETVAALTRSDLMTLPTVTFETSTNWTSGTPSFTGTPLRALLDQYDITEGEIEILAINGYSVVIPVEDPTNEGALLAYLLDGEPMSARNKGPLWLVYDYDSDREYQTETVFSRSIWQLDRIIISR